MVTTFLHFLLCVITPRKIGKPSKWTSTTKYNITQNIDNQPILAIQQQKHTCAPNSQEDVLVWLSQFHTPVHNMKKESELAFLTWRSRKPFLQWTTSDTQIFRNLPDRIPQRILLHSPKILGFTRDRALQTQTATNQLLFNLHLSQLEALLFNGLPSHDWHHANVLQQIPIQLQILPTILHQNLHSLRQQNSKNSSQLHMSTPAAGSWGLWHDNSSEL